MRLPLILVLPLLILNVLVDWYICRSIDKQKHPLLRNIAKWTSVALFLFFVGVIVMPKRAGSNSDLVALMWCLYGYFTIYIGKYIYCILDLLGRIPQLFRRKRVKAMRPVAAGIGCGISLLILWGAFNRFNIDVQELTFADKSLPESFEGFRVVQLSDIHTGTYGTDTAYLANVVERVNGLNPDVVLFTGDIVNRQSCELEPFVSTLAGIKAPYGVYSVLGNHDYGDYYKWPSDSAKEADRRHLAELQQRMGWKLMNNTHVVLRRDSDSIVVIGVENIGDPPFPVYGDLDVAYPTLDDDAFKILMSHNPAHWVEDIAGAPDKNIALTLSGHTHAMQIELFGYSPAAFRYDTWGGMYDGTDGHNRLYVNIGIGEVGFPARIGATPEITLFTLTSKE